MEKQVKNNPGITTVRLPAALHARVKELAAKSGHSMNKEIIHLLESRIRALDLSEIAQQNDETHRMLRVLIDRL